MKIIKYSSVILLVIVFTIALTACNDDILQEVVDNLNNETDLHDGLQGIYKIRAEKRGNSAIAVIFTAELEEIATAEVSQIVAEGGADEFQEAVEIMRKARISNPEVILEFINMSGILIYTHVFN